MADEAARRRELRRKRILENAEERKRKIFGTTLAPCDPTEPQACEDPPVPCLADQQPRPPQTLPARPCAAPSIDDSQNSLGDSICPPPSVSVAPSHALATDESTTAAATAATTNRRGPLTSTPKSERHSPTALHPGTRLFNGSPPGPTEQLLNFSRLSAANGTLGSPGVHEAPLPPVPEPPRSPVVPVVLALVVCCLLTFNLGYIVSHSVAFPFLLWEGHSLWCRWQALQTSQRGAAGLMAFALMLSGVSQATVASCVILLNIAKCFVDDLSLYMFTVVMWASVVGLPDPSQGQPAAAATAAAAAAGVDASLGLGPNQVLDDMDMLDDF